MSIFVFLPLLAYSAAQLCPAVVVECKPGSCEPGLTCKVVSGVNECPHTVCDSEPNCTLDIKCEANTCKADQTCNVVLETETECAKTECVSKVDKTTTVSATKAEGTATATGTSDGTGLDVVYWLNFVGLIL